MKQRCAIRFLLTLGVLATLYGSQQAAFAAASLDGVDDYISLPSGTIPDSNVTIAMWETGKPFFRCAPESSACLLGSAERL